MRSTSAWVRVWLGSRRRSSSERSWRGLAGSGLLEGGAALGSPRCSSASSSDCRWNAPRSEGGCRSAGSTWLSWCAIGVQGLSKSQASAIKRNDDIYPVFRGFSRRLTIDLVEVVRGTITRRMRRYFRQGSTVFPMSRTRPQVVAVLVGWPRSVCGGRPGGTCVASSTLEGGPIVPAPSTGDGDGAVYLILTGPFRSSPVVLDALDLDSEPSETTKAALTKAMTPILVWMTCDQAAGVAVRCPRDVGRRIACRGRPGRDRDAGGTIRRMRRSNAGVAARSDESTIRSCRVAAPPQRQRFRELPQAGRAGRAVAGARAGSAPRADQAHCRSCTRKSGLTR